MKKQLLILSLFFVTFLLKAQEEIVERFSYGYDLVSDGSKYGLKKKTKYIIPVFFDTIIEIQNNDGSASKNYFLVYQNGHQGVFTKDGKMLIPVTFHYVNPYAPDLGLFEVTDIGVRAFYITKILEGVHTFLKIDNTLLANRYETDLNDWLSVMQYALDQNYSAEFKKLIPDLNKVDPKTKIIFESFIKQQEASLIKTHTIFHFWGSKKMSINLNFDNENDLYKTAKFSSLVNFPVTGITAEQAKLFCELKSKMYNEELNPYFDEYKIGIRFRLPKIDEWEKMALTGLSDAMKSNQTFDSMNIKQCPLFAFRYNYTCESIEKMKEARGEGVVYNNDFWPSNTGLFNVFGNVAEMIEEKNYCKGGSIAHFAVEAAINKTLTFTQPEPWLGFRQVADFVFVKN